MASKQQLEDLLRPVVESLGCQLWGLEYMSQGRHTTLRLYIDSPDGIGVEHCEKVSRQVSAIMDVEDPIAGEYTLEVSSPGLDRPLYTIEQFQQYVGGVISLRLRQAFEGRRKFQGLLNGVENDEILLVVDNEEYVLPFEWIEKARVEPTV